MQASFQIINIDPPLTMDMAGYSERDHGATQIHDSLTASVLLVEQEGQMAALVSVDVIAVDRYLSHEVANLAHQKCGISKDHIFISAIHTHSSVSCSRIHSLQSKLAHQEYSQEETTYYQQLIYKLAGAIAACSTRLQPAKFSYGVTSCKGLGTNRNQPDGYYDSNVYMLKVETTQKELIALVVSHACHPTVLNHVNYSFTADYVGGFRQAMKSCDKKVMFLQGAAGSASCRYTRKASDFAEAQRLGACLAQVVELTYQNLESQGEGKIKQTWLELTLPVKEFDSEEEMLAQIAKYQAKMQQLISTQAPESEIRRLYVTTQGAERNLKTKRQLKEKTISSRIPILSLGFCHFVGLPGDVFGEIGEDIRQIMPPCTLVCGYTYDFVGYIVSRQGYSMDCYEKNLSYFDQRAHGIIVDLIEQGKKEILS